jgi:hypothetical protein
MQLDRETNCKVESWLLATTYTPSPPGTSISSYYIAVIPAEEQGIFEYDKLVSVLENLLHVRLLGS